MSPGRVSLPEWGRSVLVSGETYADALSVAPLAAASGGPVLLTHFAALDEATAAEITRLRARQDLLGWPGGAGVRPGRGPLFLVSRRAEGIVALMGTDRSDTAASVAERVKAKLGAVTGVVLAPGDSFADALSAAPLAAAQGWPILLTPAEGPVPAATIQASWRLGSRKGSAVGTYADPACQVGSDPYGANDRYDTSAKIAEYAVAQGSPCPPGDSDR